MRVRGRRVVPTNPWLGEEIRREGCFLPGAKEARFALSQQNNNKSKEVRMKRHSTLFTIFVVGTLAITLLLFSFDRASAEFPSKPLTLYAPFTGVTELSGRLLAEAAGKYLGEPITLVPKPGAAGCIALNTVAKSKPDGYTLGILTGAQSSVSHMRGAPFKVLEDFSPIMQFIDYRFAIVVKADSPYKTLGEFIEYCKQNPGKVSYSTGGRGAISHLCMARILHKSGATANVVPCKGAPNALSKVLGGHLEASSICFWEPHVKEGKLRALAVFLERRSPDFPDVPTAKELGFGMPPAPYVGIAGPAGLPKDIAAKLEDSFTKGLNDPIFKDGMKKILMEINYKNSADFKKHVEDCYYELEKVVTELGLVMKKK
jgi:tripartite-type tricarboxylate transporter receptor subunit TctC